MNGTNDDYEQGYQDGSTGLAQYSTANKYVDGYNEGRIEFLKWMDEHGDNNA